MEQGRGSAVGSARDCLSPRLLPNFTLSRISQHRDLKKLQIYYRETGAEIAARI